MVLTRPELELKRRAPLAGGQPGTHEFVREATSIVGFEDTCDFICNGVADDVEIQAAIVYVNTLGGGKIFIKRGIYVASVAILIYSNISIEGEGKATEIQTTANIQIFDAVGNALVHKLGISIRNIYLSGSNDGNNQVGVQCQYIEDSIIEGLWIEDMGRDGIQLLEDSLRCIVSNNMVLDCEDDGISLNDAEQNIIIGNTCNGMTNDGIHIVNDSNKNTVVGNICYLNGASGIRVSSIATSSNYNDIVGNICEENTLHGIFLEAGDYGVTVGNTCINNTGTGIMLTSFHNAVISNNTANGNTLRGIYLSLSSDNAVTGNTCQGNTLHGIHLFNNSDNTLTGNTCKDNVQDGILIRDSSDNTLVGNTCNENDSENTNTYDGIAIDGDSDDNLVHSNTCNDNDKYGIHIQNVNADRNWVKNNQLRGNTAAPFVNTGTDTKLETIPLYIVQYNSNTTHEDGVEIDEAGEWASFVGQLPPHVQQVMWYNIWAVALADPGADNQMCLEIDIQGGASHEPKTQHDTGVLAGQLCVEIDPSVDDIIHWVCTDANARNLTGGDSVKCVVRHNIAVASDIATDAAFRRVLVHIV